VLGRRNTINQTKERIIGGLSLFGDAFRAFTLPFAILWLAVPVLACLLSRPTMLSCFTLTGLRSAQVVLMTVVIALSFAMFACSDYVRNRFVRHFVA